MNGLGLRLPDGFKSALPARCEVTGVANRRVHHTEYRIARFDQRDVDSKFPVAFNELTRAIEWINQPNGIPLRAHAVRRSIRFFGQRGNVGGEQFEPGHDGLVCKTIRFCYR